MILDESVTPIYIYIYMYICRSIDKWNFLKVHVVALAT